MRAALAALILTAWPVTAGAQGAPARFNPAAPENRQVMPTFNYATVESVIASIGGRSERRGTPDQPALAVTMPNNRRAAVLFGSCERQGAACKALTIQAVWTVPANSNPQRLAENIANFNRRYGFARAIVTAEGRPALTRYLTADFGFIRGNLAVNLLVFANQSERFAAEVLR